MYSKIFPSVFQKMGGVFRRIVAKNAGKDCWNDLFFSGIEQESRIEAVSAETNVQARLRQETSDEGSARKR